jgi:two-component system response regulator YesN
VIIADDEPRIRKALVEIIDWESLGFEVCATAHDGQDALEKIEQNGCDLLVTDIRMPRLSGLDLIRRLREDARPLKIIILSGYEDKEYLRSAIQFSVESYLLKPINPDELYSILGNTAESLDRELSERRFVSRGIQSLKDNTFSRFLRNEIRASEFRNKLDSLGLSRFMTWSDYGCGILRFYQREETAELFRPLHTDETEERELLPFTGRRLPEGGSSLVFRDTEGHVVLFYSSSFPLEEFFRSYAREVERRFDTAVILVSGGMAERPEELVGAYEKARQMQHYALIHRGSRLYLPSDTEEYLGRERPAAAVDFQQITRFLRENDPDGLKALVTECMETEEGRSLPELRQTVVDFMFGIVSSIREQEQDLDGILEALEISLETISACGSSAELLNSTLELCDRAFAFLERTLYSDYSQLVREIVGYIHSHYGEGISLKYLAREMGLTSSYMGQIFRKDTGVGFSEFVNRYRIEQSCLLLKDTNLKISEIARQTGFQDVHYFLKIFKKYRDQSPSEFRNFLS